MLIIEVKEVQKFKKVVNKDDSTFQDCDIEESYDSNIKVIMSSYI